MGSFMGENVQFYVAQQKDAKIQRIVTYISVVIYDLG